MKARKLAGLLTLLGSLVSQVGCDSNDGRTEAFDAGTDATVLDASIDAGPITTDGGSDAGTDAAAPIDSGFDAGPLVAPTLWNRVPGDDDLIARSALWALGSGAVGSGDSCSTCHGITLERVQSWRELTQSAIWSCLSDRELATPQAARAAIECMRPRGRFEPQTLGIFAAAARLPWFEYAFKRAYGAKWQQAHEDFLELIAMPPSDGIDEPSVFAFDQRTFDIVAEWFARGIPLAEEHLDSGPTPTDCTTEIGPEVRLHVERMATAGWRVRNRESGMLMFGCAGASNALECLSDKQLASSTTFGATWDVVPDSRARILFSTDSASAYWTRSSPDGRFTGHGLAGGGGRMIDLASGRVMWMRGSYDPGFFPDGSGFMFLGGGGVCEQSLLLDPETTSISFEERQCRSGDPVGLYEHLGASLDGGDYWAVYGQFVADNGGHAPTFGDPPVFFAEDSVIHVARMTNTGSGFENSGSYEIAGSYEGDSSMSQSSTLIASRFGAERHLGFVLRKLQVTQSGEGELEVRAPEVGRICIRGGKPAFSYDERFIVLHHYIDGSEEDALELGFSGASDPEFAPYLESGTSNLYLVDLLDGTSTRITHMGPGQYALFPHFRSDGWIYFLVRSSNGERGVEHVVATDAALRLQDE